MGDVFRVSGEAPEAVFSGGSGAAERTRRLRPVPPPPAPRAPAIDLAEAEEFLRLFHAENQVEVPIQQRLARMRYEVETTGTYRHTPDELSYGAKVAWRNSARCIGRLYWRSLKVRDLRDVHTVSGVAAHCVEHLRMATNGGKIRPVISVFPPETPQRPAPRIWNEQLIRYAGYRSQDGNVLGDPRYARFTETVTGYGWRAPARPTGFDPLPLVVETREEGAHMFALPPDAVHEVPMTHPDLPWFAELGLRWHAVPVISNMRLSIGGVSYPAAPFNGWYMGTEIGARNFADNDRYNLVPVVAERLGLDTSREDTLWRDRALVELNRAVLHSYQQAGVTITDHHTESHRFLTHLAKEESAGRKCPVDWSWIVPPMSGAQTPVFHRYYDTEAPGPNYYADDEATQRALTGGPPHFA